MPRFTIVIPTFNNAETLAYCIPSVLAQDYSDFELFIVGDGCPEVSNEIITSFMRQDSRIRFFDNPKGARHGELHRHAALQEASGHYVTYLSDDDLMLPQHLSTVLPYLDQGYNFVHTLPVHVLPQSMHEQSRAITIRGIPDRKLYLHLGGIENQRSIERLLSGINFLSLSAVTHSRELYRSLPFGWRTTPVGIPTDLYMWQQFAQAPSFKATGIYAATIIHCGKDLRATWTLEERVTEIRAWAEMLTRPNLSHDITEATFSHCVARALADQETIADLTIKVDENATRIQLNNTQQLLNSTTEELSRERHEHEAARATLSQIQTSITWRLANRLRRYSFLTRPVRWLASSLSRSEAR